MLQFVHNLSHMPPDFFANHSLRLFPVNIDFLFPYPSLQLLPYSVQLIRQPDVDQKYTAVGSDLLKRKAFEPP
ncbi:hypothetical protein [Paenibacillus ehimensis]|uniref:Uncharacterized protein n=1 Tax=Paenibacillus ehimensis TaxID=79264 RepID=A0ABT8VIN9_9BACL|nr:hypothetical protein [Paenibacillus ehimensis]MDO3680814.1 hypothetical protein [Paenibacillus ehimensis]MEC0213123.1 hypothetical protein [Paenibacillus ehimensis]